MKYLFFALIAVLILVIWSTWNEYKWRKRLKSRLKQEWGNVPEEEYTAEKQESIRAFFLAERDDIKDVDDITWNDLDMQEIYMLMNNTQCAIGEEYLYALLRKPCFSKEELAERNRLIHFFSEQEEIRIMLQMKLNPIGKLSSISVYEYINRLEEQEPKSNLPHYLMLLGMILSIASIAINPGYGGAFTGLFVVFNMYYYYKEKSLIEKYLTVFAFIVRLLDGTKEIYKLDIPEIKKYTDEIKQDAQHFRQFRKGSKWLTPKQASGSFTEIILDYIRMLTHIDLIKYNSMLDFLKKNRTILNRLYRTIGYLDSLIAAGSFRAYLPFYCEPELMKTSKPGISVTGLYHPLLDTPVENSIHEYQSVLLTGSNASGKSTFIKTLAINAILSQTVFTSVSRGYVGSYFMICSSMALRDNLLNKESYYIVEIKSLKRILDRINDKIPVLCFIDEVLRGTNTLERIAASSRILSSLGSVNALVFAATHDIELTHILEKNYANYHFQERIENNEVIFDYKLYKGKAVSRNAIRLLDMLGYPKDITSAAMAAAEEFTSRGEWSTINMK